jgi:hypothetical protein
LISAAATGRSRTVAKTLPGGREQKDETPSRAVVTGKIK